jgi:hypothetical protein
MTSIVPNRTHVEGRILSIEDSTHLEDFRVLKIKAHQIGEVSAFTNLINEPNDSVLWVHVSKDVVDKHKLKEGLDLSVHIRKSPKDLFVIPDSLQVK